MPVTSYKTVNGRIRGEATGGARKGYLTDALGSVTATVDAAGAVENAYRHKPYGQPLAKTGNGTDPRFLWTGDTGSRTTGLPHAEQYNRARHYGSKQASWTSVDPLWPEEIAYVYVRGNPTTWIDPEGNQNRPHSDARSYGRLELPPGESYIVNCCRAMKHPLPTGLKWFYLQVRGKGPWDYKQKSGTDKTGYHDYQDAGNYHYGFMAACCGIPKTTALFAAGHAQIQAGTSRPEWQRTCFVTYPNDGLSGFDVTISAPAPPYGDDPVDQAWISNGYDEAVRWMPEIKRKCRAMGLID